MIFPAEGNWPPDKILRRVDFPEPLDPVIASLDPEWISREMFEKTFFWLKALLSFCIDRSIDGIVGAEASHDPAL